MTNQPPPPAPPTPTVHTSGGPVSPVRYWIGVGVLLAVLLWGVGSFHCVSGDRPGGCSRLITKESWGLGDQFVNVDDYAGHSVLEIVGRGKVEVARALIRAGCVAAPD